MLPFIFEVEQVERRPGDAGLSGRTRSSIFAPVDGAGQEKCNKREKQYWRESAVGDAIVDTGTIAQMIDLMSTIREQSQQRLLGMTRMRRGWVQDLLIGYFFIFSLEWMYYKGVLTPLSVSIKWVNRIMVGLVPLD